MLLIILEGLEKTGKTTIANELAIQWGASIIKVDFPTILKIFGELLARQLWAGMHVSKIIELEKSGCKCAVIDRGFISNIVYGVSRMEFDISTDMNTLISLSKNMQVITFYLNATDEVLNARTRENKPKLALDDTKLMRELFSKYTKIAEEAGVISVTLDASKSIQELIGDIEYCIYELLGWERSNQE